MTETITESKGMMVVFRLIPPFVCIFEYFGIVVMIAMLVFLECTPLVQFLIFVVAAIGIGMLPFWFRTFFDTTFIGPDRPLFVQWSDDRIQFCGGYFRLDVPVKDILFFKTIGFCRSERTFMLKITIRKANGKKESTYLSTSMSRKSDLITFLKKHLSPQKFE